MRILIVGGTGAIGGHAALHLKSLGHDVVLSSRNPPAKGTGLEALEWLAGNYLEGSFAQADLEGFEGIVFAAGNDVRHLPAGSEAGPEADAHYIKANGEEIPKFAALAKAAGVQCFINIGSFYPQVLPEKIATDAYVRSRDMADKGVRALSDDNFRAMSLNASFVVGHPDGMASDMFAAYVNYARGLYPNIKPFGPAGGSNFISVQSLSEAIAGAIERGEGGAAYLMGDENLSFQDYFQLFFSAGGNPITIPSLDEEHPMLPDSAIVQGRGNFIRFEPDAEEAALLGFRRNDIARTIKAVVADLDKRVGTVAPVNLGPDAQNVPELTRLAHLYARANDAGNVDILKAIMTDDIVVQGPGFKIEGLDNVAAVPGMLQQFYDGTEHIVNQVLVEVTGDSAVGETFCTANHILYPEEGQPRRILTWNIRYQDRFVKVDGAWRFQYRGLLVDWLEVRDVVIPIV